ncbi:homoprotocatechuate degradation regulator HpaR [Actimicrobium sp. GrIS 1.19]|uniref:homoprotocatechuate degradation operon regulator HpaR n=1 Tax=Actimicrobium sp. GrIS 1.19 TaxID=3071708 RepID=UPI002E060749|nr:homoprotocatechuate degradation regulator HpaR [Actimicrobium sp. GrIS 1.19]
MKRHSGTRITQRNLPQLFLKSRDCLMTHFRPILNHFGVTEQQWRVLRALDEHGPLEPHQIGAQCQIVSASMAGVLARMEQQGLIRRARIATDQRRVLVTLAAKGDRIIGDIAPLIDQQYRHIEEAFGAPMLSALIAALEAFANADGEQVQRVDLTAPALRPSRT